MRGRILYHSNEKRLQLLKRLLFGRKRIGKFEAIIRRMPNEYRDSV
jgi:hypothetical protein